MSGSSRGLQIVLLIILLFILVALIAAGRLFIFRPSEPEVRLIALGGGAIVPDDALSGLSSAEARAKTVNSGVEVYPPSAGGLIVLDDLVVASTPVAERAIMVTDFRDLRAAGTTGEVAVAIRAVAEDRQGIESFEIKIDDQPVGDTIPARPPVTNYTQDVCLMLRARGSGGESPRTNLASGSHTVTIIAWRGNETVGTSEEIGLYVDREMAVTDVRTCEAGLFPITSQATPTLTPTPSPTPTPTPTPTKHCRDNADFVTDLTVPDGTMFEPGAAFNKTWQLKNTGSCTWNTRYQLVFVGGAQLGAPHAVNMPHEVRPGDTVDITVPMVAPQHSGTYRGHWRMRNPDCGNLFGVTVHVHIIVRPGTGNLPVITRFEVVPTVINQGQQATIFWEYVNGTSARLHPGDQAVGPTGSQAVAPNTTTNYRLVVTNAAGSVERTSTLTVQPGPIPGAPPSSPANLTITGVRSDGFDFTWIDTSGDEQGFRLYDANTQQVVATFPANITSGAIAGVACGTPYRFYLASYNERGESWPSNTVEASTSACG